MNPFFKNKGPFQIDKLLKLSELKNTSNYKSTKIYDIKDLSTSTLESFYSAATDKIPGNLIKGDVVAGALKYFKSPLKKISTNPHLSNVLDKANKLLG